jgi:hypothetical protein
MTNCTLHLLHTHLCTLLSRHTHYPPTYSFHQLTHTKSNILPMGGGAAYHDIRGHGCNQREGMGLLEYQVMPSMCDIAYVGGLGTPSDSLAAAAARFSRSSQLSSSYRRYSTSGQAAMTVHHGQNHPCWVTPPASKAGRRVGPAL